VTIVVSLIEELVVRKGVVAALSGRDEAGLDNVLQFLLRNINNPAFSDILLSFALLIIDIYPVFGNSVAIDESLLKLKVKVGEEMELQKKMFELKGVMEFMITRSKLNQIVKTLC
jgi:U3 small nucleolar RNA-associated protein 15